MATRLTKAQLLARIDQLESELGLRDSTIAQLQREIDAEMVRSRPSRNTTPAALPPSQVRVGGELCWKVRSLEGGRMVTTYKPVSRYPQPPMGTH